MRKTAQKLILFLSLLALIKLPFALFYLDEQNFRKAKFSENKYDTVFIGSSRTKYAVMPSYFDALTERQTKSYNFGVDAGLPPQTFDWCENLIESSQSLRYVFFELSGGIKTMSFTELENSQNHLAIDFFRPQMPIQYFDYNFPFENVLEDGELEAKIPVSPENIRLSLSFNQRVENDLVSSFPSKENYWVRIKRLIELAEAKQIRVFFFVPPRLETENELKTVLPIYRELEAKYKLTVNHYEQRLYEEETSINDFHLNRAGAVIFTENMAQAFNELNF